MDNRWSLKPADFGPLAKFVECETVTDINYYDGNLWIDDLEDGKYKAVGVEVTEEFMTQFATRISNTINRNFNANDCVLEAETEQLRLSFIHQSVTVKGIAMSVRKTPPMRRLDVPMMLETGYCDKETIKFLQDCVKAHMNIAFCGLPGSGKTELLKYLTKFIPSTEKVVTIEDNLEIHYGQINPDSNCVEMKVGNEMTYTVALKATLRQNAQWILLSEARSTEVKYLLEGFSTGLNGLTTLHTDDVRKIPTRIINMLKDSSDASRLKGDIYSFVNVGVLVRKKIDPATGKIKRYIDQICVFDCIEEDNVAVMVLEHGKMVKDVKFPPNIKYKLSDYR